MTSRFFDAAVAKGMMSFRKVRDIMKTQPDKGLWRLSMRWFRKSWYSCSASLSIISFRILSQINHHIVCVKHITIQYIVYIVKGKHKVPVPISAGVS